MRTARITACLAALGLVASLQLVAAPAASAAGTDLPMHDAIFDMVVDGAHDHVFVSSGTGESALTVLDYTGTIVTTLPIAGASGMALVGSTMYVAAADADNITVVDTSTAPPSVTGTLPIGTFTHPESIAYVAGKLWFTTGACGSAVEHVRIDTDGTGISTGKTLGAAYCPRYATNPADPNMLLMFDEGLSPMTLYEYDMSTSPVTLVTSAANADGGDNGYDAAFAPAGASVFTASGAPYEFPQIKTTDLSLIRAYTAEPYPTAVDVTDTAGGRLAGGSNSIYGNSVWAYDIGATTDTWHEALPNNESVVPRGVAWSDDGTSVFAVAQTGGGNTVRLYVLDPLGFDSTLTLTAKPANATVDDKITLTGTLAFADSSSSGGQTVSITRDDAKGTHAVKDVVTASDGTYQLTDKADLGGTITYHAAFAGAGHAQPSEASDSVSVQKLSTNVSVKVSDAAVTFGQSVRITGHLGNGTQSRVLELYAKPDGGNKVLLRKAKVDRHGNLSTAYSPSRDTTFSARYDGDLRHKSKEDSAVTRVKVILKAKLVKFASTSGAYKIYKGGTYGHCAVHVSPDHSGHSVKGTLQAYTGGSWKTVDTGSFKLNAKSNVELLVRGSSNVNFRLMVKMPTHSDHIGDSSPWLYLRFK